jgi:tetratricopeptide (TPR) repeat protein
LGELYAIEGKYVASLKSLDKSLEMGGGIMAIYFKAFVNHRLGFFEQSIEDYRTVLESTESFPVIKGFSDSLVSFAKDCFENGAFGRGLEALLECIQACAKVPDLLLKTIGDCCFLINKLADSLIKDYSIINDSIQIIKNAFNVTELEEEGSYPVLCLGIYCFQLCLLDYKKDPEIISGIHTDIAILYHKFGDQYKDLSIIHCKQGLFYNPENVSNWNMLGLLLLNTEPKIAQHCFIQSLQIKESAETWCNLGYFYLIQEDLSLSRECFKKSQSCDPELCESWFGLAIITQTLSDGDYKELLIHANELQKNANQEMFNFYAQECFGFGVETFEFNSAVFCLRKLDELGDTESLNLFGLYLEKQKHYQTAVVVFKKALDSMNLRLEEIAKIRENLARCLCSMKLYNESIEQYQLILPGDSYTLANYGISLYHNELYSESLEAFEKALENESDSASRNDIQFLTSQVLYALGSDQHIEVCQSLLFKCFQSNPAFIKPIIALLALGLIQKDYTLAETAANELLKLESNDDIDFILSRMFILNDRKKSLGFLQKSIHKCPSKAKFWARLADSVYM